METFAPFTISCYRVAFPFNLRPVDVHELCPASRTMIVIRFGPRRHVPLKTKLLAS